MSSSTERELKGKFESAGYFAVRSAGSLGQGDIVAIRPRTRTTSPFGATEYLPPRAVIIEDKKTNNPKVFYFTDAGAKAKDQWEAHRPLVRAGHEVWWAVKFTSGERANRWRFYRVEDRDCVPLKREEGMTFEEAFS